jgi:hypothetical protein
MWHLPKDLNDFNNDSNFILERINKSFSNIASTSDHDNNNVTTQRGKCQVCNDDASGLHYGVLTCEGCKVRSFFFYKFDQLNEIVKFCFCFCI